MKKGASWTYDTPSLLFPKGMCIQISESESYNPPF